MLTGKCCFLCGIALIFVSLLVLNLLTGAGAYIKHERDLYVLSAVYQIYCTVVTFEVWLQWEINKYICMLYNPCEGYNTFIITEPEVIINCVISQTGVV